MMRGSRETRRWQLAATLALLVLCLSACGHARSGTASSSKLHARDRTAAGGVTLPQPELKIDAELDSDSYPGEVDNDNNHVFGRVASVSDTRAATTLVKRYYAAAAAGDGALACRLMYSSVAESVAEDYGQAPGTSARAETCAVAISKLFKRIHKQLSADRATLKVAAVHVRRREASVLLRFGGTRQADYLALHRERGVWKLSRLLASEQAIYLE